MSELNYRIKRRVAADPRLEATLGRTGLEFTERSFAADAGVELSVARRFLTKRCYQGEIERVRPGVYWRRP